MHASIQATLYNAHFDHQGEPWTPDDLLGRTSRQERLTGRVVAKWKALAPEKELAGDDTELPDWATRCNEWKVN